MEMIREQFVERGNAVRGKEKVIEGKICFKDKSAVANWFDGTEGESSARPTSDVVISVDKSDIVCYGRLEMSRSIGNQVKMFNFDGTVGGIAGNVRKVSWEVEVRKPESGYEISMKWDGKELKGTLVHMFGDMRFEVKEEMAIPNCIASEENGSGDIGIVFDDSLEFECRSEHWDNLESDNLDNVDDDSAQVRSKRDRSEIEEAEDWATGECDNEGDCPARKRAKLWKLQQHRLERKEMNRSRVFPTPERISVRYCHGGDLMVSFNVDMSCIGGIRTFAQEGIDLVLSLIRVPKYLDVGKVSMASIICNSSSPDFKREHEQVVSLENAKEVNGIHNFAATISSESVGRIPPGEYIVCAWTRSRKEWAESPTMMLSTAKIFRVSDSVKDTKIIVRQPRTKPAAITAHMVSKEACVVSVSANWLIPSRIFEIGMEILDELSNKWVAHPIKKCTESSKAPVKGRGTQSKESDVDDEQNLFAIRVLLEEGSANSLSRKLVIQDIPENRRIRFHVKSVDAESLVEPEMKQKYAAVVLGASSCAVHSSVQETSSNESSDADCEGNNCSICFENVHLSEFSIPSCCCHVFHTACLQRWLSTGCKDKKKTCPMCRSECSHEHIFEKCKEKKCRVLSSPKRSLFHQGGANTRAPIYRSIPTTVATI